MKFAFLVVLLCGSLEASIDLKEAQVAQFEFDQEFFEINNGFEKLRHVLLHLAKTVGKMAAYCEAKEHGRDTDMAVLRDEVAPDLLIHALQIANSLDADLGVQYEGRLNFVKQRALKRP